MFHPPEVYFGDKKESKLYFGAMGTDIWAIGCILYTLTKGEMPFKAENISDLKKQLQSK